MTKQSKQNALLAIKQLDLYLFDIIDGENPEVYQQLRRSINSMQAIITKAKSTD